MISYGGIRLIEPSPPLASWIMGSIPPRDAFRFPKRKTLTNFMDPHRILSGFISRPVCANVYFNPWGASRWGMTFGLVDGTSLTEIRDLAYASSVYTALDYVMADEAGTTLTTELSMLVPVPLSKFETDDDIQAVTDDLYLLPLVDERYFWWERAAAITVTDGATTWAQLFAAIATGLGISLTVDTISADYLKPGATLGKQYDYLPILLDLAAASVGHRVIRNYDGTIETLNATSALALQTSQSALYDKFAGGSLYLVGGLDA